MKPEDIWATDTADPARIFREMFPSPAPRLDWRLFSCPEPAWQFARVYRCRA